jgi:hypothetical protein
MLYNHFGFHAVQCIRSFLTEECDRRQLLVSSAPQPCQLSHWHRWRYDRRLRAVLLLVHGQHSIAPNEAASIYIFQSDT